MAGWCVLLGGLHPILFLLFLAPSLVLSPIYLRKVYRLYALQATFGPPHLVPGWDGRQIQASSTFLFVLGGGLLKQI